MALKNIPTIDRQRAYVQDLKQRHFKYGLTVGTAFVRGIRDIGDVQACKGKLRRNGNGALNRVVAGTLRVAEVR